MTLRFNAATIALALTLGLSATTQTAAQAASGNSYAPRMYSATAISQRPGEDERSGKIAKSGPNMRLEFTRDGHDIVQIFLPTRGLFYVLDPETKTYTEAHGPAVSPSAVDGYMPPCPNNAPNLRCELIGRAVVSGVPTERWMIRTRGQAGPAIVLWDPLRRQALREDFADGTVMALAFRGLKDVAGRPTEHWGVTITRTDKSVATGEWLYDTDLRTPVGESIPGTEARHLESIVVGPVDPALFAVPKGWKRIRPAAAQPTPDPAAKTAAHATTVADDATPIPAASQ